MNGDAWICRAVVGPPHGIVGAVHLRPTTDYPERLEAADSLRLRLTDGSVLEYPVEWLKPHRGDWLLKLVGVEDRGQAELLRGAEVIEPAETLPPLPEGEYYWHQLVGLAVETDDGRPLGRITEVLRTGANDVYVTERVLIPALREVIRSVDLQAGRMVITPLPGLLESCGST